MNLERFEQHPSNWLYTPIGDKSDTPTDKQTGKRPLLSDWQNRPLTADELSQEIAKFNGQCTGIGLLTDPRNGLIAVDHDGHSADYLITEFSGLSLEQALPKTIGFTSGKPDRYQLLYQIPDAFREWIKGKAFLTGVKDPQNKDEQLDLRYGVGKQSALPPSLHKESGNHYQWLEGQSPNNVEVAECPLWIIRKILNFSSLRVKPRKDWTDEHWALAYLEFIPNQDFDWYQWRDILMALHHAEVDEDIARLWSSTSEKHSDLGFDDVWKHIDDNTPNPLTVATLGHLAIKNGWQGNSPHHLRMVESEEPQDEDSNDSSETVDHLESLKEIDKPSLFHPSLNDRLNKVAELMNLPSEVFEACLLPVLGSRLHPQTRLEIDPVTEFYVPGVIWVGLVGETGTRKSPMIRSLTRPLDLIQEESEIEYQNKMAEFDIAQREFESLSKEERVTADKPIQPTANEAYLSDFTLEALAQVINNQKDSGILISIDELARFFGSMDAYRSARSDRQHWLSFHDAGPLKVNRKSTGRVYASRTNISVLGGIQPSVIQNLMMNDASVHDGLWCRFAWVRIGLAIAPGIGKSKPTGLRELLTDIYRKLSDLSPFTCRLSEEAIDLWNAWHLEIERLIINEPSEIIRAVYPKARERAARIALIIHCTNALLASGTPVAELSAETLERSIQFSRWLIGQTKLLYAEIEASCSPEVSLILRFKDRFSGKGWVNARSTVRWWPKKDRPNAREARLFMGKVVKLGHAVSNGESTESPKYQIKIFHKSTDSTDKGPLSHTEEEFHVSVPHTDSILTGTDKIGPPPSDDTYLSPSVSTLSVPHTDSHKASSDSSCSHFVSTVSTIHDGEENSEVSLDPREAITIAHGQVSVDIEQLSLDYQPTVEPPEWNPIQELKPYDQLAKLYLDIETTGLDPKTDRVIMIGVMDERGTHHIFTDPNERSLLNDFLVYLVKNKPNILITHNGFAFDLPFLIERCKKWKINQSFRFGRREKAITASSFHGKPIQFKPVYWSGVQILDTFQQIAIWDKQAAKLTSYGLKNCTIALGLREDRRLELSHQQIQDCWVNRDLETIQQYLIYDLEDTRRLADFLLPVVYSQLSVVSDISLQDLAVASPALKAEKIHESLYPKSYKPIADKPLKYEGGKVECVGPGLHSNVAKIDVSSLYPSVMLRYGICSSKDKDHKFLGVLRYLRDERLRLKALAKDGDKQAGFTEKAYKILINGAYGFLGTRGYSFNDYGAAALVTAYGRKILDLMTDVVSVHNGTVIELDTDGILFSHDDPQTVCDEVQHSLPDGISVELELSNCGLYAPKAKNYVIVHPDGKTTVKGIFRKRNRYPLEREFPVEYLKRYFLESPEAANEYYQEVRASIQNRTISVEQLTITRKIAVSEKSLVEHGIGQPGDIVSYYFTEGKRAHKRTGKPLKSAAVETTEGDYWVEWYLHKIDAQYQEITGDRTETESDKSQQLQLEVTA